MSATRPAIPPHSRRGRARSHAQIGGPRARTDPRRSCRSGRLSCARCFREPGQLQTAALRDRVVVDLVLVIERRADRVVVDDVFLVEGRARDRDVRDAAGRRWFLVGTSGAGAAGGRAGNRLGRRIRDGRAPGVGRWSRRRGGGGRRTRVGRRGSGPVPAAVGVASFRVRAAPGCVQSPPRWPPRARRAAWSPAVSPVAGRRAPEPSRPAVKWQRLAARPALEPSQPAEKWQRAAARRARARSRPAERSRPAGRGRLSRRGRLDARLGRRRRGRRLALRRPRAARPAGSRQAVGRAGALSRRARRP